MVQDKLLDIAVREFGAKGIEGTSTRGIAAAAGTAMSSITYHYGGKEGLYRAAAEHIAAIMADEMDATLAACDGVEEVEEARRCVHLLLGRLTAKLVGDRHADWTLFIMREQMAPGAAFDCFYKGAMGRLVEQLALLVARATGRPDDLATRACAMTLFGQVIAFRASRALALRVMRRAEIDDEAGAAIAAAVRTNTDAILDRLAAGRQEPR